MESSGYSSLTMMKSEHLSPSLGVRITLTAEKGSCSRERSGERHEHAYRANACPDRQHPIHSL